MEKIVNIYRRLSLVPALLDAKLSKSGNLIYSIWSHRNLEKGKTTKFLRSILLYSDLSTDCVFQPVDVSNEALVLSSPSEKYRAVLRETEEKQYLEIWQHQNLFRTVDLSAIDVHGKVYTDVEFKSLEWSPDELKLLYIAEKKTPDSEPFYQRKAKKDVSSEGKSVTPGQEYVFQQDWGEQMVGKKNSVIAEYSIQEDTVKVLQGLPDDACPGQVKYSPCGEYVVGVAFNNTPRKLGLIYCSNRSGVIFKLKEGKYEIISDKNKAVRAPIFTPKGDAIIYFEREAKGPHMSAAALVQRNFPESNSDSQKTLVKIVQEEMEIENGEKFYGLYNMSTIKRCWASENRLVISTNQKNEIKSYVVDIDTGKITQLPCDEGSLIVLDVHNDVLVANRRNFLTPDVLVICKLPAKGQESSLVWKELTQKKMVDNLEHMKYEYLELCQDAEDSVKKFSAIYVGPSSGQDKSIPLIVYPHGGPHSAFANNFSLDVAFHLSNGYALLLINYRGSIGAGDKTVHFLLGRIGTSDVSDCILATNKTLEKFSWLDPNRVVLCGGSHGGFLVTHLSGQYPDMFKAVVSRNPVIDVSSMSIFSDIPDWCFVECGEEYTQKGVADDQLLLKMRKVSPIVHAHKVKAPTMLQVGSQDLRVPPGQSYDYYHRLKANGVKVQMHLYDDCHPLSQVKNEIDNLINTALWFNEHVGK
ncbi:hypothetical protein WA026_021437 [Henosepilachna vigintioctopunctata]|uniref:Prolyl endopeptidase n=1 Tax=Henosepilachna vigintioctopunctata TaxID=420089 RepID=A0AAW1TXV8_9CUCU